MCTKNMHALKKFTKIPVEHVQGITDFFEMIMMVRLCGMAHSKHTVLYSNKDFPQLMLGAHVHECCGTLCVPCVRCLQAAYKV